MVTYRRPHTFPIGVVIVGVLLVMLFRQSFSTEVDEVPTAAPPHETLASVISSSADELSVTPQQHQSHLEAVSSRRPAPLSPMKRPSQQCRDDYKHLSKHAFVIHRFLWLKHSIEILAMSAFVDVLGKLYCGSEVGFVDVGVNDGEDLWYWFKAFGDGPAPCAGRTRFTLFEPQAQYQDGIQKLIAGRKDATLHHAAVGKDDQHGSTLTMSGKNQQGRVNLDGKSTAKGGVPVAIKSLRRTVTESVPIVVLKIDCEGADPTILVNSRPMFEAHTVKLLIFEVNTMVKRFKINYYEAALMLHETGYRMFYVGLRSNDTETGFYVFEANPLQVRRWAPNLETMIALSPDLIDAIKDGDNLFAKIGGRIMTDVERRGLRVGSSCFEGTFALPCPMCRQPLRKAS